MHNKTLGDYYRQVDVNYGLWYSDSDSIVDFMYDNYKIAYEHGVYDANSLRCMGYYLLLNEEYENSIPFYEKSVALDPKNANG